MSKAAPASGARRLWQTAKLVIGVGLVALIVSRIEWAQAAALYRRLDPGWLAAYMVVGITDRLWMAAKWHYLARSLGVSVRLRETMYTYFLGVLGGFAAQSQVGGDILRAVRLSRQSGQRRLVVASVLYEKLTGFAISGVFAAGSLALLNHRFELVDWRLAAPLLALTTAVFLALPLLVFSKVGVRCLLWLIRSRPKLCQRLGLEEQAVVLLRDARKASRVFVGLTIGEQFVPLLSSMLLQWSLGIHVGLVRTASVVPIALFAWRLPVSIEGLGVYEGMSMLLFSLMGLTATQGFSLAVADRLGGLACTFVCLGAFSLLVRRREPAASPAP